MTDTTTPLFLALILILMVPWAVNQFRLMIHYPDLHSNIYMMDDYEGDYRGG